MRQTELHLSDKDRALIESYRASGSHLAREVNRAHILSALDKGMTFNPDHGGSRHRTHRPLENTGCIPGRRCRACVA